MLMALGEGCRQGWGSFPAASPLLLSELVEHP